MPGFWSLISSTPQRYADIRAALSSVALECTNQVNGGLQAISEMLIGSGNLVLDSAKEYRTSSEIMEEGLARLVNASTSWAKAKTPVYMSVA